MCQVKLMRHADRTLELLEADEAKFADELTVQQQEFAATVTALATVSVAGHCPEHASSSPVSG
jgi:hypothetical protein